MSLLVFLLFGLLVGAIAKMIMPGNQGGGWLSALLLGVLGAWLGGFIGSALFDVDFINKGFFNIFAWIFAIIGALLCMVIWGFIQKSLSRAR